MTSDMETPESGSNNDIDLESLDWSNAEPLLPLEEFADFDDLDNGQTIDEQIERWQQDAAQQNVAAGRESAPPSEPSDDHIRDTQYSEYNDMEDTALGAMIAGRAGQDTVIKAEADQGSLPSTEDQRDVDSAVDPMSSTPKSEHSGITSHHRSQAMEHLRPSGGGSRNDPIELSDDEENLEDERASQDSRGGLAQEASVATDGNGSGGTFGQGPHTERGHSGQLRSGDSSKAKRAVRGQSSEDEPRSSTDDSASLDGIDHDQTQQPVDKPIEDGSEVEDEYGITEAMQGRTWGEKFSDPAEGVAFLETGLGVVKWAKVKDEDWEEVQEQASSWIKRTCEAMFAKPDPPRWEGKNAAKSASYVAGQKKAMRTLRICQQSARNRKILEARVASLIDRVITMHKQGGVSKLYMVVREDHGRRLRPKTTYTCSGRLSDIVDVIRRNKRVAADVSEGNVEELICAPELYIQRKLNNASTNSTKKDILGINRKIQDDEQKAKSAAAAEKARKRMTGEIPVDPWTGVEQTPQQESDARATPNSWPAPSDRRETQQRLDSASGRGAPPESGGVLVPVVVGGESEVQETARDQPSRTRRRRRPVASSTRTGSTTIDPQDEVLQAHIARIKRAASTPIGGKLASNFDLPEDDFLAAQPRVPQKGEKRRALDEADSAVPTRKKLKKTGARKKDQAQADENQAQGVRPSPYTSSSSYAVDPEVGFLSSLPHSGNLPSSTGGSPPFDDPLDSFGQQPVAPPQAENYSYNTGTGHTGFEPPMTGMPGPNTYNPYPQNSDFSNVANEDADDIPYPSSVQDFWRGTAAADGASPGQPFGRFGASQERHHRRRR